MDVFLLVLCTTMDNQYANIQCNLLYQWNHLVTYLMCFFLRLIITCRLWVIYVREDNYSNVKVMIKRLIWTIWTLMSSVLKKADKLNLSLSLMWVCPQWGSAVSRVPKFAMSVGIFQDINRHKDHQMVFDVIFWWSIWEMASDDKWPLHVGLDKLWSSLGTISREVCNGLTLIK